jgi:hypothetical protein
MDTETWIMIYETYEISNMGNLRKNGKILQGSIQNRGYKYFQLQREGKRINLLFHHLVALAFIGERPDNLVIDHINRNKLDNRVVNLRYITQTENMKNQDRYKVDILETDPIKRRAICHKQLYEKTKVLKNTQRKSGSGSLYQRENGRWRAKIDINKITYDKTFDTKDQAEQFLLSHHSSFPI